MLHVVTGCSGGMASHRRTRDVSDVRHGGTTEVVRLSFSNDGTSPDRLSGSRTTATRDMIERVSKRACQPVLPS